MPAKLTPSEALTYCTVRIECLLSNGQTGVGTGFFFAFLQDGNMSVPALVTNKHVVENAKEGRFLLHVAGQDGGPKLGSNITVKLDTFEQRWIPHPDSDTDLCIMPVAPLLHEANKQQRQVFFVPLDHNLIPTPAEVQEFAALEEIVMIGYPIGIWDSKNNMPVIRRGITATHVGIDYEGRQEFLIDAACFPGSSGSPVFLFSTSGHTMKSGGLSIGLRMKLLGILYGGPQYTAEGEVIAITIPTQKKVLAVSQIPINLGMCIKAQRILDFEPILKPLVEKEKDRNA
jgi:hypothetical protein